MNSRNKGIIIITAACIVAVITSAVFGFKYAKAKEQLETLQAQDCTEHEKTIARLNQEVQQLQDKVNAADSNNETDISEKALFFLTTFYSDNQAENIKPLMTDSAYKKLYSTTAAEEYQTSSEYRVNFTNETVYYSKISQTECDVLIFADFNVDSLSGKTTSPFLFHIKMKYESNNWLVSDIVQNTTVNYNS